jgi:2-polyprenyl-6-methoxyphenol hydroxylase-like FAD-dependent oxidoreductase
MASAKPSYLIIGGSVAGPTLASFLLLSPLKPSITILERRSKSQTLIGQNIDIRGPGITIAEKLGIKQAILDSSTGEEGVQWVDEQNRVCAAIPAAAGGGTAEIEICRGDLASILYQKVQDLSTDAEKGGNQGVEWIYGDYLSKIEQQGNKVRVEFAKGGQKRVFDLVIGADGLQSSTRKLVWGTEGEKDRIHNLHMYTAFFSAPKGPNDGMWRRWFHASGRRGIMIRPDRVRGRSTGLMYVINDKDAQLSEAASRAGGGVERQKKMMSEYFHGAGWETERVLKDMWDSQDFYYDMTAQVKMDKWSKGRVVLIGDAA